VAAAAKQSQAPDEPSLEEMLKEHRRLGVMHCAKVWLKARTLQEFVGGDQWPADRRRLQGVVGEAAAAAGGERSPRLSMNEIRPVLQAFSGRQMMQRFQREYTPRNADWARRAEVMTMVDRALMEACDAEQAESAAFKDGPGVQGVSWVRYYMDDPDGEGQDRLVVRDVPIWAMLWDPDAREINLRDRGWHRFGEWWPAREVLARWGKAAFAEIAAANARPFMAEAPDKSSRIPWSGMEGNRPVEIYEPRKGHLWIELEEWRESEDVWQVALPTDPQMSYEDARAASAQAPEGAPDPVQIVEMEPKEYREWRAQYEASFGRPAPREMAARKSRQAFFYAYLSGDYVIEHDKSQVGCWTFSPMTGFRVPGPKETTWQGLVEGLTDAQKWMNVMITALIRHLQASPKGGLLVEEGFFKNRAQAMSDWASPLGVITVARGKLTGGSPGFQQLQGGQSPYSQFVQGLLEMYREAIPRLAGFNPAALGQLGGDIRRVSGQVVRSVQDAAMTSNAELFDSLRLHRRTGGRIVLSFLRKFYTIDDLIEIIGQENAYEDVPVAPDPQTGKPALDPATGQPATTKQLAIPDPEDWKPGTWKGIAVEEVTPQGDLLADLWQSLTDAGALQILLQPMQDSGEPLFASEDLAEIIPYLPAPRREKIKQRVLAAIARKTQAEASQGPPPPKVSANIAVKYETLDPASQQGVDQMIGLHPAQSPTPDQSGAPPS
jgi:hypothetical protein